MSIISFYERSKGSSHEASGKPCQDYGLCYEHNGVYIVIVCDGHGGNSYVRSDKGAELAAKITHKEILDFVNMLPKSFFKDKEGSATAIPTINPLQDVNGNKIDFNNLSESQQEIVRQNKAYIDNKDKYPQIECAFRTLFYYIVTAWKQAIQEDHDHVPFSDREKEQLGNRQIEKAYGTTLMAAVRTPKYWFAFHIGDGKLLTCDKLLQWTEPVPWDCNCFLNITTSLCDTDPVKEFRYAFNGTGQFPMAFVLGSDGIDDTFTNPELTQKFYSQMLCVFNKYSKEEALKSLKKHLPVLSEKGSHDDMSVAAIIDTTNLSLSIQYYDILLQAKELNSERLEKENILKQLQHEIEKLDKYQKASIRERDEFCRQAWKRYLDLLEVRRKDKEEIERRKVICEEDKTKSDLLKKELASQQKEFQEWKLKGKDRINCLKSDAEHIKEKIYSYKKDEVPADSITSDSVTTPKETKNEKRYVIALPPSFVTQSEKELWDKESEEQVREILNIQQNKNNKL